MTSTLSPAPAPRRTWLDRLTFGFPLLGAIAILVLVVAPVITVAWVYWDFNRSIRLLEARVGPLDPETLMRPPVSAADNRALALLAAGQELLLSDDERLALGKIGTLPEPETAFPPEAGAALLAKHERLFALLQEAVDRPADNWGVDYRLGAEAPLPNFLPQLQIARLVLLEGTLALAKGERRRALSAAVLLRRQAESLYSEGPLVQILIARAGEALQHRLLARLIADPDLSLEELRETANARCTADLDEVWRQTVRREASWIGGNPAAFAAAALEDDEADAGQDEPRERTQHAFGSTVGHLAVRYMMGGALSWWAKASATWEESPEEIDRRLTLRPEGWGRLRMLRNLLTPNFADAIAKLRETDEARTLLSVGIALRRKQLEDGLACAAAWEALGQVRPSTEAVAFEPSNDGGCRLKSRVIPELHRVFPPNENSTRPITELHLAGTAR